MSLKVIGTDMDRPSMTSDYPPIATMGPSRTLSEINGDFSQKSQIFPTSISLSPCMKEFPVKLGIGVPDQKNLE